LLLLLLLLYLLIRRMAFCYSITLAHFFTVGRKYVRSLCSSFLCADIRTLEPVDRYCVVWYEYGATEVYNHVALLNFLQPAEQ